MAPKQPPKVSTTDFLFVFGPNDTCLVRAPSNISRSTLRVSSDLASKIESSKGINFVVFPPEPETAEEKEETDAQPAPVDPYVSYSKKGHVGDSKLSIPSENFFSGLSDWLKARWGSGGLQVVGNARGAWWGHSSSGTTQWTPNLPRDVRQLLKPYNPHGKVTHLALGVEGAYVFLFEDGHIDWDLKGQYSGLDAQLEVVSQGDLVYVSLSAYQPDHFFAAFADATVLYQFPDGTEDLDEDFVAAEPLRVIVPSETAKHSAMPVSKTPAAIKSFTTDVAKDVTGKAIENALFN